MIKFWLLLIIFIIGCMFNTVTTKVDVNNVKVDTLQLNKERAIKNLSNDDYCDSIGLTTLFSLTNDEKLYTSHKHSEVVSKYLEKLPHKDIQIKYMLKYNIDPSVAILINYQECTFKNIKHNGKLNKGKYKDWGSLQLNAGYFPNGKKYILKGDYDAYYDYAYSIMKDKKPHNNNLKIWFTNWNSKNKTQAVKYHSNFIKRTRKYNTDLRMLLL